MLQSGSPDFRQGGIDKRAVSAPDGFYKAVLRQDGDESCHAIAFVFEDNATRQPLKDAVVTVDALEAQIGYDLFANHDDSVEAGIDSVADWEDWRIIVGLPFPDLDEMD